MKLQFWRAPTWRIQSWALLAILALLVMEAAVSALWYQALFWPSDTPWVGIFLILLLISGVSYLLTQVMETLHWRMVTRLIVFVGWLLSAIFISLKLILYPYNAIPLADLLLLPFRYIITFTAEGDISFFHLIWICLIIRRGVTLSRAPAGLISVQISFQLGLAAILVYGMIFAPLHPTEAAVGLYGFLFCGLIAMSAARIYNLSELRGGRIPRFGPRWLASILLAGSVVVGAALLAGWLLSGQIARILATAVLVIFALLTTLVLFLLSPLLLALARLIPYLTDFLQQLYARFANLPFFSQIEKIIQDLSSGLQTALPYLLIARGLLLVVILAVLILAVVLALRLRRLRQDLIEEAEGSAVPPAEGDLSLPGLLRRLLQDTLNRRLRSPAQILAAARIRQIYRQLIALSLKFGTARPPSMTPLEFLPRLEGVFTGEHDALQIITGAYLKVRYGQYPETRQEVADVETAWAHIRRKKRPRRT